MKDLFYFDKKKLAYENVKSKTYIQGLGVLVVAFGLGWISNTKVIDRIVHKNRDTTNNRIFSEKALINLLSNCNIKYPHIVLAQAKLESNNFTSQLFKQNHNLFGMKKAHQRATTAQSEKDAYAFYRDWIDCVYDMGMYQSSVMCSIVSEEGYFNKLGERYAEDSVYVFKLKNIIKREKLKSIFED